MTVSDNAVRGEGLGIYFEFSELFLLKHVKN